MSNTNQETELALYARIEDPESLKEADLIEDHIQLESTLISGARIRVRKITPIKGGIEGGADQYVMTLKIKEEDQGGIPSSAETSQETDRGFFEQFAKVAHRAIVKRRYSFIGNAPVIKGVENIVLPAVKYEVDQFIDPNTRAPCEWYKLDIELDEVLKALGDAGIETAGVKQRFDLTKLSFVSSDMFTAASANPEQKKLLGELWETKFSQKLAPDQYTLTDSKPLNDSQPVPSKEVQTTDTSKVNADETTQEQTESTQVSDQTASQ